MNLMLFGKHVIGCSMMVIAFYIIGKNFFKEKSSKLNIRTIIAILLFSIFMAFVNVMIDSLTRMLAIYVAGMFFYKYVFQKNLSRSIVGSFIAYVIVILSEIIIVPIIAIVLDLFTNISIESLKNNLLINLMISLFSLVIMLPLRNFVSSVIDKTNNADNKTVILITSLILITIFSFIYKVTGKDVQLNFDFIMNMVLIIASMIIAILIINQKSKTNTLSKKYGQLISYSKTSERLLEEYRKTVHEGKNQLVIISSMILPENIELREYVNQLIDQKKNINFQWINELKYIPAVGLKGFLNYKIMVMEEKNISVDVHVDKNIEKSKLKHLNIKLLDNLYSILGVYLDNAIEAAEVSKLKMININIYRQKTKVTIEISNSYKGKINQEKLDEYGYSSKGMKRGVGLHLATKLIQENPIFTNERQITKDWFIQSLIVDCNELKKKKTFKNQKS